MWQQWLPFPFSQSGSQNGQQTDLHNNFYRSQVLMMLARFGDHYRKTFSAPGSAQRKKERWNKGPKSPVFSSLRPTVLEHLRTYADQASRKAWGISESSHVDVQTKPQLWSQVQNVNTVCEHWKRKNTENWVLKALTLSSEIRNIREPLQISCLFLDTKKWWEGGVHVPFPYRFCKSVSWLKVLWQNAKD